MERLWSHVYAKENLNVPSEDHPVKLEGILYTTFYDNNVSNRIKQCRSIECRTIFYDVTLFHGVVQHDNTHAYHCTHNISYRIISYRTTPCLIIPYYTVHQVLLTEAPLNPTSNREKAAEIFFEGLNVPALFCSLQVRTIGCLYVLPLFICFFFYSCFSFWMSFSYCFFPFLFSSSLFYCFPSILLFLYSFFSSSFAAFGRP